MLDDHDVQLVMQRLEGRAVRGIHLEEHAVIEGRFNRGSARPRRVALPL